MGEDMVERSRSALAEISGLVGDAFNGIVGATQALDAIDDVAKAALNTITSAKAADPTLLALLIEAAEFIQPFNRAEELSDRIEAAIKSALGGEGR